MSSTFMSQADFPTHDMCSTRNEVFDLGTSFLLTLIKPVLKPGLQVIVGSDLDYIVKMDGGR